MEKKIRAHDIISTIGLIAIIYGFAVATLVTPDATFSADENRYLQQKPKFTIDSLTSGKFTSQISDYFSDQIPLRNLFVGIKAVSEIAMQKQENDDVLLGSNGHIIAKTDYMNYTQADKNLNAISRFSENLENIDFHVAIAGRSQDVLAKYMPVLYPAEERAAKLFSYVADSLGGIKQIDLLEPLKSRADAGEYVYYRTDHHWATLGAYYAYVEIMNAYGIEPYQLGYFTRETASDEFFGTSWSKAGMKWIKPDTIEFFRYPGDETMITEIIDTGEKLEGMYDLDYLSVKDKYSAFIGGNNGRVRIYPSETSQFAKEKRETLILVKDSFGHSLAPFLAAHFDLEIIDLRYYRLPLINLVNEIGAEKVLILYNMDGVYNSNSLPMLGYGLK